MIKMIIIIANIPNMFFLFIENDYYFRQIKQLWLKYAFYYK